MGKIAAGVLLSILIMGCEKNPEELWLEKQFTKCRSMNSKGFYDNRTKEFVCTRAPFARFPKTMFKETYKW